MADEEPETLTPEGEAPEATPEIPQEPPANTEAEPEKPQTPEEGDEEQKHLVEAIDRVLNAHFPEGEAPVEPEGETVTLSKAELAERERRARQSEGEKARAEADAQARAHEQAAQQEAAARAQFRQQVEILAQTAVDNEGKLRPDFADGLLSAHETSVQQRAQAQAIAQQDQALVLAARGLEFIQKAAPEDWEPMQRQARNRIEEVGQLLQVAHNTGRSAMKAETDGEVERRVSAQVKTARAAIRKELLAELRVGQPNGELPAGSQTDGLTQMQRLERRLAAGEQLSPKELGEYSAWSAGQLR